MTEWAEADLDADGFPSLAAVIRECGPTPRPHDHDCDVKGPVREITSGLGVVYSSTCSVCGRPAFNTWDVFS
jgi:hypothetical protein